MSTGTRRQKVGEVRPSQILTTFGVGSIIDLPYLSVLVMGLEDWPDRFAGEIGEERLLLSVREVLGTQVRALKSPPRPPESSTVAGNPLVDGVNLGVPVASFPRWMVCPTCRLLAPIGSDLFEPKPNLYRPDQMKYVHRLCPASKGKPPTVVPARFLVACPKGHLDDFPWAWYAHRGGECPHALLRLFEFGTSGEAADVFVKCDTCGARRAMSEAFARAQQSNLPRCRGRRPHLRDLAPNGCEVEHVTAILQGASNSWFSIFLSALSVPGAVDTLGQAVEEHWSTLKNIQSLQNIELLRQFGNLRDFAAVSDDDLWRAIERKRSQGEGQSTGDPGDLKSPEYDIFCNPSPEKNTADFRLRPVPPPEDYADVIEQVVLVERVREVRALIGFTRIGSPGDYDSPADIPEEFRAPLSRKPPQWIPASEVRGEGIFLRFREEAIARWSRSVAGHDAEFFDAHKKWRAARNLEPEHGYDHLGIRFVLLHSFAHALIRQLSVECGYTTASIRERIYSRNPGGDEPPMAGVLIYTAAADSEGTLGGLVSLGEPDMLGRHLDHALEMVRLCSSDPLCAEHRPHQGSTLHGAACHACLFVPETSCERGNKYLDRSVLVETLERSELAFFRHGRDGISRTPITPKTQSTAPRPPAPTPTPAPPGHGLEVEEALAYSDERCHDLIRDCARLGLALPVVGHELQDQRGRVCAEAELAWPDLGLGVLRPYGREERATFEERGWTVLDIDELAGRRSELLDRLRGE